ncbi:MULTISPECIES: hypothetical protein [Streptomyces]|uniref:Uncharacterized protein n=1 Tax=Streptomyces flavovirens TaxID=52258 RepID=A0ABV8ND83_9ACTN|nr:hypothetical protein [Streptomyces sp. MBT51]MBK3592418.1 hypothetical protein [Streptomyces sp. MBT51]
MTTELASETAYGRLIRHTAKCRTCRAGEPCREEAELRSANRIAARAAARRCADCGASETQAQLTDQYFPGFSGPGGPAVPLCDPCAQGRADERQRQVEAFVEQLTRGFRGAGE